MCTASPRWRSPRAPGASACPPDYLVRLRDAGLSLAAGHGRRDPRRRRTRRICPDKINTAEWLDCHAAAHEVGLRSNITMMFGSIEQPISWARHFLVTRRCRRPRRLHRVRGIAVRAHGRADVSQARCAPRAHVARGHPRARVARIVYNDDIDNIQASWVKLGSAGAAQLLRAGVNDLGGTLMDENISRADRCSHGQMLDVDGFEAIAASCGRQARQRTTLYDMVPV